MQFFHLLGLAGSSLFILIGMAMLSGENTVGGVFVSVIGACGLYIVLAESEGLGIDSAVEGGEQGGGKKKWTCDSCGRVNYKDPNITGTACPDCGKKMSCSSITKDKLKVKWKCSNCEHTTSRVISKYSKVKVTRCPGCSSKMYLTPDSEEKVIRRNKVKVDNEKDHHSPTSRSSNTGTVYVLVNPEMPDLVKIGYTTRSAAKRAKEVSGTGVPGQWKVAHEFGVDRPKELEKRVHRRLSSQRTSSGEFFKVSPKKAASEIKRAAS